MVARVTTSQRSQPEEAKLFIEEYAIPSLQKLPGFRGAFFLADGPRGTGISISLWEDAAAAEASDHASSARRGLAARMTGAIFESVDTYDVIAQAEPNLSPAPPG